MHDEMDDGTENVGHNAQDRARVEEEFRLFRQEFIESVCRDGFCVRSAFVFVFQDLSREVFQNVARIQRRLRGDTSNAQQQADVFPQRCGSHLPLQIPVCFRDLFLSADSAPTHATRRWST